MSLHRRQLLTLAAAAPALVAGRVWAAPQTRTRLLVVFLRGAYDAANVVIPTGSDFYYQARPSLHIAKPDPANPDAALPLDADWSLHPALKDTIYPLWTAGQAAFIPFTGVGDDLSRSHFETQDALELGQPLQGSRDYGSGFMSRLTAQLAGPQPIAFTDEGFQVRDEVYRSISTEMAAANRGAVSPKGFELSARRIGRLMKAEYNLGFVDIGGWDTHVNHGAAQGYLAGRLGELGRGLAGFVDEIGPDAWKDTVVVTVSEFGRTFRENGDRGTDHGHGSVYWGLGGGLKGGRLAGEQTKVVETTLNQNRDYAVLTDYRALMGGLFSRIYGLNATQLGQVFPGAAPRDLQLV